MFFKRYLDWPLRRRDLFKLPRIAINSAIDILTKKPPKDKSSFTDFIKSKYGNTLYETFFKPYTSKFLRWDPEDLHSDWASTGINRAVIDEEVSQKTETSLSIVKSLILPAKVDTRFKYPDTGGFGNFFDILYANCNNYESFTAFLGSRISSIENQGNKDGNLQIKIGEKEITANKLVWTGNLNDLNKLIINADSEIPSSPKMNYLNTRFVNLTLKENSISTNKAQWIYISDGSLLTSRITCMKEFNPNTCNYGYYNIICEVTESQSQSSLIEKRPSEKQLGLKVIDELKDIDF